MGYIKLNRDNLFHNLDYFSSICGSKDKISVALKDNAYGHGIVEIASLLNEYGIKEVFVRNLYEAQIIERFNFKTVLVLYEIPKSLNPKLNISINSLDDLKKIPLNSTIELKLDTSMNRNGLVKEEFKEAVKLIKDKKLNLYGVFTHFCCADEENNITKDQEKIFLQFVEYFKTYFNNFRIHCAASAGVHKIDMSRYNIARIGIGAYGYLDLNESKYLKPVLSLWAVKIATKKLKKGDHIGYGSKAFVAQKDMIVSNYNIGYGDGFFRFSEVKKGYIANNKEILGRVSMDSFSIESSDDEVVVFDDASKIAQLNNTITYEVLASLNPFIKKYIV